MSTYTQNNIGTVDSCAAEYYFERDPHTHTLFYGHYSKISIVVSHDIIMNLKYSNITFEKGEKHITGKE